MRYRGRGTPPAAQVRRIRRGDDVVVVEASPRMLLVEADSDTLRDLMAELPDWVMTPEQTFTVPDTRTRIERPPD